MNKTKLVNCFLSGRRKSISKYENQTEELQSKVLQKLIRQAIHTEWGQTHGFAQVNDYNSFTKTSPINTYEELKGYIDRMRRGEKDVLWSVKGTYDKAGNFINDYWAIGLSVSLPIFNRNQGNIRAAKISVAQKAHKEEYARRHAENELFTSYARLEKAIQLYRSSNYGLEKDFALIIEGVNLNFQKRNISLLEFIDYYETYKTTCLQLYQTQKEVLLALEEVNTVTGSHVFNY